MNTPIRLLTTLLILSVILSPSLTGSFPAPPPQQEGIHDFAEVEVTNVPLRVRVYHRHKSVSGLQKEDFKIFEEGKERPINAFFVRKKKLELNSPHIDTVADPTPHRPRLFLLIFNVDAFHVCLIRNINDLFNNLLRPGDRLIAITNNLVLQEHIIYDLEEAKINVIQLLQQDILRLIMKRKQLGLKLSTTVSELLVMLSANLGQMTDYATGFSYFFQNYTTHVNDLRQEYLSLPTTEYIKIADYLKKQPVEKWVLSFFQVPAFPKPNMESIFSKLITPEDTFLFDEFKNQYSNYLHQLEPLDLAEAEALGNLFANTGATFHTLLLNSYDNSNLEHYDFQSISTNSENILRSLTARTGGYLYHSQHIEDFISRIAEKEDAYYELNYTPANPGHPLAPIRVVLTKNKNYHLVYDSNENSEYARKLSRGIKKQDRKIAIQRLFLRNRYIHAVIDDIMLVPAEIPGKPKLGKIDTHLAIRDRKGKIIFQARKQFQCRDNRSMMRVRRPRLKKGTYSLILEVKDLSSWKTDVKGLTIEI